MRRNSRPTLIIFCCFNPRTRTGCDRADARLRHKEIVSIHAPARGATTERCCHHCHCGVSIHAPARGATRFRRCVPRIDQRFNPRTRTGCDPILRPCGQKRWVSIHAPARGATKTMLLYSIMIRFQSTHPHGVRQRLPNVLEVHLLFQSTHPHGVRPGRNRNG